MLCVTGLFDYIKFFRPLTLERLFTISTNEENCRVASVSSCGFSDHHVIAVSEYFGNSSVTLYDVDQACRTVSIVGHRGCIYGLESVGVTTGLSRPRVVSGDSYGQVFVSNSANGDRICSLSDPPSTTYDILCVPVWSPAEIYVCGSAASLVRYDVDKEIRMSQYRFHGQHDVQDGLSVNSLSCDPDRQVLFSCGEDRIVKLFSRDSERCEAALTLTNPGYCICYVADLNRLLIGTYDGSVEIWDSRKLEARLLRFSPCSKTIRGIDRISRDAFVSVSRDRKVTIWDLEGTILSSRKTEAACFGVVVLDRERDSADMISVPPPPTPTLSSEEVFRMMRQIQEKDLEIHTLMEEKSKAFREREVAVLTEASNRSREDLLLERRDLGCKLEDERVRRKELEMALEARNIEVTAMQEKILKLERSLASLQSTKQVE